MGKEKNTNPAVRIPCDRIAKYLERQKQRQRKYDLVSYSISNDSLFIYQTIWNLLGDLYSDPLKPIILLDIRFSRINESIIESKLPVYDFYICDHTRKIIADRTRMVYYADHYTMDLKELIAWSSIKTGDNDVANGSFTNSAFCIFKTDNLLSDASKALPCLSSLKSPYYVVDFTCILNMIREFNSSLGFEFVKIEINTLSDKNNYNMKLSIDRKKYDELVSGPKIQTRIVNN